MGDSTWTDPLGRKITLHENTWTRHILRGHPDVARYRKQAGSTIASPNAITISASDPDCRLYYGRPVRKNVRIVVVANVVGGFVKTAYLSKKPPGGSIEWSPPMQSKGP